MAYTYILYSQSLDKYYIGHTEMTVEQRLSKHLTEHSGFTAKAKDWQIVWTAIFHQKSDAYAMERKIKNWKSRKLIEKLIGA
jgi:putative endonuclease